MENIQFKNVDKIGDLFLERVLLNYENIPILFTCKDIFENYYLIFCSDFREPSSWTIAKVDAKTIIDMLHTKITMQEAFFYSKNPVYIIEKQNGKYRVYETILDKDSLDFPEEGLYFREMYRMPEQLSFGNFERNRKGGII